MPQIPTHEFERLPLRVHAFLAGVPLHDAWAVDLPKARPGITLDEFQRSAGACRVVLDELQRTASACCFTPSRVTTALLRTRFFVGGLLGWDREPSEATWETFAARLTPADRAKSLAQEGAREGLFRVVYRFENEQLLELINRTAHAAALSTLLETANGYRFYFAVYVRRVGPLTPVYMTLIDPFRKLVVYPSLLRGVRDRWRDTFETT